ncbi:inner membrane protein translocase component YidC [Spiroplasma sp. TIUS-1]|uniref:membrane protein insertase YidC n=1 Tax=Spiroplasma sp. TIUS-1 TaxID=216963 RepID=UPI0013985BCA|nr:membrane protein insertase YidC [Spiroplasma sp. TIUS-1]QHX36251.1 inner membrane protein translocase component YidC [Spiroplasma sp. TIUS-1]
MYKHKPDYNKYFSNRDGNQGNKNINPDGSKPNWFKRIPFKRIWKITKIVLFLFLIFSALWGCVQMMQPDYIVSQVTDQFGNKMFSSGVGFEIAFFSESAFKSQWTVLIKGSPYTYSLNYVSSWGEAFTNTGFSPFYGFFVYPMSALLVWIVSLFSAVDAAGLMDPTSTSYGVAAFFSIVFAAIAIRGLTLAFSFKAQMNQGKMNELSIKSSAINDKYKGQTSNEAKMKKQREISELYKKEGVSQVSMIVSMLVSMPFLIAMLATIRASHAFKVGSVGSVSFIATPFSEMTAGNFQYLAIVVVYLMLQITTMFLPQFLEKFLSKNPKSYTAEQKKAKKKQLIFQIIFIVMFFFIINSIAAGVAIYWIFSSLFQVCQTVGFFIYRENAKAINEKKRAKKIAKLEAAAAKHKE